jgi:hypothetical protein
VDELIAQAGALLHEAAETHHIVFRITDGADDDWASWYSDWLTNHSELGHLMGGGIVRSHLTAALVRLDQQYAADRPDEPWENFYARDLVGRFRSTG